MPDSQTEGALMSQLCQRSIRKTPSTRASPRNTDWRSAHHTMSWRGLARGRHFRARTDTGKVSVTRACTMATHPHRYPCIGPACARLWESGLGIRTPSRGVNAFSSASKSREQTFLSYIQWAVLVMGQCSRPAWRCHSASQRSPIVEAMQPPRVQVG